MLNIKFIVHYLKSIDVPYLLHNQSGAPAKPTTNS